MISRFRRESCFCKFSSRLVPGFHHFVDQGSGGSEAHRHPPLTGGQSHTEGYVGLTGAAVAGGDDVLTAPDVFTAGQFCCQDLVHRGDGQKVECVQTLYGRKFGRPDRPLHQALVAVDEFQLSQAEQVPGMVHIFGGAPGGHLPILTKEAGQPELFQVVFQE